MSLYYSSRRRLSVACVEGEIILHKTYTLAEIVPKCVDHDDKPLWFRDHCKKTFTSPVVCKHFARNCWRNNVLKGDGCYYNGSRLSRDHTVYTTTPCQKVECDGNGTLFLYTTFHLLPTELTPTVQNFARMARQMQYKQYLSTASLLLGLIVFRIGVVSPSQRSPQTSFDSMRCSAGSKGPFFEEKMGASMTTNGLKEVRIIPVRNLARWSNVIRMGPSLFTHAFSLRVVVAEIQEIPTNPSRNAARFVLLIEAKNF
ncbi:uncharacterized protein LOC142590279 isoform X2 [Dermacentor variabilis]|uniref:uncharacterized protein LOC142590279 isoform X2 n=1 Tax=Dermacentor variabilis TaxID=34621 RepID=UPI003F5BCFB0